jgi:hypothetical protein
VDGIPLLKCLRKLVLELGAPIDEATWGIFYRFSRPVERWRTLRPKLIAALHNYQENHAPARRFIEVAPSFQMTIFRYPVLKSTRYFVAGDADEDSGGYLISLMKTNIAHCISEKSAKIAPYRSRYPKWWLVLVDGIGFSFASLDQELFSQQVSLEHAWDRVVVISHHDPALSIDV